MKAVTLSLETAELIEYVLRKATHWDVSGLPDVIEAHRDQALDALETAIAKADDAAAIAKATGGKS